MCSPSAAESCIELIGVAICIIQIRRFLKVRDLMLRLAAKPSHSTVGSWWARRSGSTLPLCPEQIYKRMKTPVEGIFGGSSGIAHGTADEKAVQRIVWPQL